MAPADALAKFMAGAEDRFTPTPAALFLKSDSADKPLLSTEEAIALLDTIFQGFANDLEAGGRATVEASLSVGSTAAAVGSVVLAALRVEPPSGMALPPALADLLGEIASALADTFAGVSKKVFRDLKRAVEKVGLEGSAPLPAAPVSGGELGEPGVSAPGWVNIIQGLTPPARHNQEAVPTRTPSLAGWARASLLAVGGWLAFWQRSAPADRAPAAVGEWRRCVTPERGEYSGD